MADNFRRLVMREPVGTRFVLWAHNFHISTIDSTVKDVWTARTFLTQRRRVHRDAESCKSLLAPNINAPVSKATEQATFAKMCFLLHCFRDDEPTLSKRTFTVSNLNIESMPHLRLGGVQGALAGARFVTTLSKPLDRHRQ